LLVVGARGLGGFRRLLLGSVSEQCLHHASYPVAVVRTSPAPAGADASPRVVVGVDGSAASQRALVWAVDEARARQVPLVRRVVPVDRPASALLEAGAGADLIVVGDRGRSGFSGLLLGSVSHQVVHHATGPVVVVRG
jgi:nucleotide-binding universal stress UspA family protein